MTDVPEEIVDEDDPLPGVVADLVRAGVDVVVEALGPRLVFDPADLRAAALAERARPALVAARDRAVSLFARLRHDAPADAPADAPVVRRCPVCRASVFLGGGVGPADVAAACGDFPEPVGSGLLVFPQRPADCPWRTQSPLAVAAIIAHQSEAA